MKRRIIFILSVLLALSLVLSSCGGGNVQSPGANAQTIAPPPNVTTSPPTTQPPTTQPTTVPPTTTPPTTQPPSGSYPEGYIFTSSPSNPKTALEVMVAFFFYCGNGQYAKAEELCTPKFKQQLIDYQYGTLEKWWQLFSGGRLLRSIKYQYHQVRNETQEIIMATFYFKNDTYREFTPYMAKINGKWLVGE